jgi:hypothetical protein
VWLDLDTRRDGSTAFHFAVNAAGVLGDVLHFNDNDFTSDWDGIWEAKVADTDRGYSIELRIPLSTLRFSALPVQDWGMQIRRVIDARQEIDDWAFLPRSAGSYVPLFGRLENLVALGSPRRLELRPFVLGRLGHRAPGSDDTLARGFEAGATAGLDAKLHLTNELTLDLAVNPDFGQVEADAAVLNLTTFETFLPEKRPFFLEGIDAFTGLRPLVYTRRVGRPPPPPVLGADRALVASPRPAPIYGAAKLVGTIGGRTTVGLLSALTGPTDVDVQDAAGLRERRRLEPLTAYHALRLKRLLGARTELGLLATATNRFESALPAGAPCPLTGEAASADGRCTNDAYVVSADGRWRSPSGKYTAMGQAIAGTLRNGPPRFDTDGIAIRPGVLAGGGALYVAKDGGAPWVWSTWQNLTGRQLTFNDFGYVERKNDYQLEAMLGYRTLAPWRRTLETQTGLELNVRRTLEGLPLWNELKLASWCMLDTFWSIAVDVHGRGAVYDDREMGDGSALERAASLGGGFEIASDPRRRVTGTLTASADARRGGGYQVNAAGRLTLRALPRLEVDLAPGVIFDAGAPRYVAIQTAAGAASGYDIAVQDARSVGATLRAAYTFTPELSLQLYTQLFLSRVRYGPFYVVPHQEGVRERVSLAQLGAAAAAPHPGLASPDTAQATLNVNLVLRWEYRLGSTLFLVYTRAQNPALVPGAGGATLELRPVLQGRAAADVIMLKLAYWWG